MFDYERKSYLQRIYLATFISTIIKHICMSGLVSSECGAALIVASLGPARLRVARVARMAVLLHGTHCTLH